MTPPDDRDSTEHMVEALTSAVHALIERDEHLLRVDANERAITHRLAGHLECMFDRPWSVDCEYNRIGGGAKSLQDADPKRIEEIEDAVVATTDDGEPLVRDTRGRTVFPDIIVHERGETENLLVVEVKKTSSGKDSSVDLMKLNAFLHNDHLRYRYACFIKIGVEDLTGSFGILLLRNEGEPIASHNFADVAYAVEFTS